MPSSQEFPSHLETLSPASSPIPWEELRGSLAGDLDLSPAAREQHSEDASVFQSRPLAVVYPKSKDDLATLLAFCREKSISVHAWGAGTSRGGQPLGPGLIVNFRRYLNRILDFNERTGELTVEPGALYAEVQKFLLARGLSFPPDPSYHQVTIGGMIANNAAGIHSVKYGGTEKHLAAVEYFTADGVLHHTDQADALSARVHQFLNSHQATITADYPKVEKNSAGYSLDRGLQPNGTLDLPRLLAGSEGTLGLITEARLRTVPIPQATALATLYFSALEPALQAAMDLRTYDIAACELVDKVLLDLHASATASPASPKHAKKIGHNTFLNRFYGLHSEAVLIVEMEGATPQEARVGLEKALGNLPTRPTEWAIANGTEEAAQMWDLRRHTSPILNRLEDGKISIKPLWAVEDVSLPRETFLAYVREQGKIFARFGLTCSFFGHAASCNLHIDPLAVDPRLARKDSELAKLYAEVARLSYALTVQFGGSISGEHGDGLLRTPFLPLQYPKAHALFASFKALFDPHGILNPGKIVAIEEGKTDD